MGLRRISGAFVAMVIGVGASGFAAAAAAEPKAPPAALPAAATTITVEDLRRHVETLASDGYEGRDTLTRGGDLARDYVAARFAESGLVPLPGQESYLVPYTLYEVGFDRTSTRLTVTTAGGARELRVGESFTPFRFSGSGKVEGEVVFAGYGISAPDLKHDDYAGLDVTGKIVLVFRHTPHENDEKHPLTGTEHALFATKAETARQRGAAAMLLVTDPLHHPDGGDDLRLPNELHPKPPAPADAARRAGAIPAIHLSREVGELLAATSGRTLSELQRAIDDGATAASLRLAGARAVVAVGERALGNPVSAFNVAGCVRGFDPALRDEWIVAGAHYDHVGASAAPAGQDGIYNGADDNASGTAGLLELAQAFAKSTPPPARSVAFVAFSGEERGLLGSAAFVEADWIPARRTMLMLNMDMIGRNPDRPIDVSGDAFATGIRELVDGANRGLDLPLAYAGLRYEANSDHHSYFERDLPYIFFFTGFHDDYHQPSDHADKIAFDWTAKIVQLGYGVLSGAASGAVTPRRIHHVTWLGVAFETERLAAGGWRVGVREVSPESRGARAGLRAGDTLVAIDAVPLGDPPALGRRFRDIVPGRKVALDVRRGAEVTSIAVERARQGFLGIGTQAVGEDQRRLLGLKETEGVTIITVMPSSPAAGAGLQVGDILVRVGSEEVDITSLPACLGRIGAGEEVEVAFMREGARHVVKLTLGARPGRAG